MPLSPVEYLRHILDETGYLTAESGNLDKEQFLRNETLKRAFVRSIEIIGEASKKVPASSPTRRSLLTAVAMDHGQLLWNFMPASSHQ